MALNSPFYLAVGTCVLEDGTGGTDYVVNDASFPEPSPDGFGGHQDAVRSVTVDVRGDTASGMAANLNTLRRQAVRDKYLYFRHGKTGDVLSSKIREASVVESFYDPLRRDSEFFSTVVEVSLVTEPYWLGAWTAEVATTACATIAAVPGYFDIAAPAGEVDALLKMRMLPARGGTLCAVGIKPAPGSGYSPTDDYGASGTDVYDANAYWGTNESGYKLVLAASATVALVGTAPTFDTNDNRGRHLLIARFDSSATRAASITVQPRAVTTGNAIALNACADYSVVTANAVDLRGQEVGIVTIPAGAVPDLDTGAGYAAEGVEVSQTTASAWVSPGASYVSQSFPVSVACLHTGVTVYYSNSGTLEYVTCSLFNSSSDSPIGTSLASGFTEVAASSSGMVRVTWDVPRALAAGTYCFKAATYADLWHSTASSYASGKMAIGTGTPSASADLYFKSHIKLPLGFNSSTPLLAADSSGCNFYLDYVQRVPLERAVVYRGTGAAGNMWFYWDGDTSTTYAADGDGIGPAILDKVEICGKGLTLEPGVVNRVVVGICQIDQTVLGGTWTYSYRPRYLTA